MISIAVTAAPRTTSVLSATLASLSLAGLPAPLIVAEPRSEVPPSHRAVFHERRNSFGNFVSALKLLVTENPSAELLAVFQDDVLAACGLWPWLADHLPDMTGDFGVVSLYTAGPNHHPPGGWHQVSPLPKRAYGALAYLFTARIAKRFVEDPQNGRGGTATDSKVGRWCRHAGLRYWTHSPSFVLHTGTESTIQPGITGQEQYRQCRQWLRSIDPWDVVEVDPCHPNQTSYARQSDGAGDGGAPELETALEHPSDH